MLTIQITRLDKNPTFARNKAGFSLRAADVRRGQPASLRVMSSNEIMKRCYHLKDNMWACLSASRAHILSSSSVSCCTWLRSFLLRGYPKYLAT